jgi:uncharacterized membrane protein
MTAGEPTAVATGSDRLTAGRLHRVLSVVAAASLVAGLRTIWINATSGSAGFGLVVTLCYLALFLLLIAALCVRGRRPLVRVDIGVLAVALVIEVIQIHRFVVERLAFTGDEGTLSAHALNALRHGHNPYALSWPRAVASFPTQLMGGGIVDRFTYPPFGIVLGAAAGLVWHSLASPVVVTGVALMGTAVFMFAVFPRELRPLAVLVIFGITFETARASNGTPAVIALPFLAVALWKWPRTGAGGRLGRSGLTRAACLGLAAATQQLAWFILPFVVVGIWRVRRGELSRRETAAVLGRYVGVSIAVFAVVNMPFAIVGLSDWLHGLTSVLTQHAVIYGPGLAMLSGNVLRGSGALDFYSYATALLYVALLVMFAVGIRRFGPLVAVLPLLVFFLSIRSEDTYYVVFAPLWVVTAVTTSRADCAGARPVPLPPWLRRPTAFRLATVALFVPAVACLAVAVLSPRPLHLRVVSTAASKAGLVTAIDVAVHNVSGHPVEPHFALVVQANLGIYWHVIEGPPTLAAGQSATYELGAPGVGPPFIATAGARLDALSDHPQTLSSVEIRAQP